MRCISFKQGSKKVYKPVAMGEKQRTQIAMDNIIEAAKRRPGKTLAERLAREFIAILQPGVKAKPVEQKETLHKLAMVNRFVPFAFSRRNVLLTRFFAGVT